MRSRRPGSVRHMPRRTASPSFWRTIRLEMPVSIHSLMQDADDVADENTVQPDREVEVAELSGELTSALSSLPSADRLLIQLRFEDGLSAAEIARVLRYPSQFHVYRHLNSVLASLRTSLRSRGFESAAS